MRKQFFLLCLTVALISGGYWFSNHNSASDRPNVDATLPFDDTGRSPLFAYVDENPLAALSQKIKDDRSAATLRVDWSGNLGSGWDEGTLSYNREKQTLVLYDKNGAGEAGEEFYFKHYRFTQVSDETIISLVNQYNNDGRIREILPFGFVYVLPKMGAKKQKIADYAIYKKYNDDNSHYSVVKKFY